MPELTPFTGTQGHPLRQPILDMIWHKYRQTPRHLQRELGPSEVGEQCTRKLAQNIMHEPILNEGDPWPSIVGTATHTWMDDACRMWNEHLGRVRFLPEQEVFPRDGQPGHCDCLDIDTLTVIDWKNVGVEPMREYRKNGPSEVYRCQAHLYGLGWTRKGIPIREVAIVFFSRGGLLSKMHIWSEPYNEQLALDTLDRYDKVVELSVALDVEHHPERYKLIETSPGHHCRYCNWLSPGPDTGIGCPGPYAKGMK